MKHNQSVKPPVQSQGKCIVEIGKDFIVLTPDGNVHFFQTKAEAESHCKTWFSKNLTYSIGIGEIEWRVGFAKPKQTVTLEASCRIVDGTRRPCWKLSTTGQVFDTEIEAEQTLGVTFTYDKHGRLTANL